RGARPLPGRGVRRRTIGNRTKRSSKCQPLHPDSSGGGPEPAASQVPLRASVPQNSTRRPNSIHRALFVRLGGVNVPVITPKADWFCRLRPGLLKFGWLKALNRSHEKRVLTRSVIFVVFPKLMSMFLTGKP